VSDPRPPIGGLTCDEVRELAAPFVLGALDADELAAVREHLDSCDDAHAEFAELGAVLPVLDASVPLVEPPAALKDRIMAAAADDLAGRASDGTAPVVATAAPVPFPSAAERETRVAARRTSPGTWALRIAAVLAIVVLGGWNLLLQGQVNASKTYEQNVAAVLEMAGQPGSLTAILTGEGGTGPAGLAAVSATGDVSMAMRDLAPTSGSQVYEAWVIGGDGIPVPLGGFSVGRDGIASFEATGLPTDPGIVLALTLEAGPGATTPTLPIVSSGTATAAG
jgi:anti-sigma-K factor RskA